jgi:hypothetical protein
MSEIIVEGYKNKFFDKIDYSIQQEPFSGSVFITGGIGDVLAVESFLTDEERNSIDTIYYATSKKEPVERLFRCTKNFSSIKNHINLWCDFTDFWCFYSLEDYLDRSNHESQYSGLESFNSFDISNLEKLYIQFLNCPESISPQWRAYFRFVFHKSASSFVEGVKKSKDLSIMTIFAQKLKYNGSSFLKYNLSNIKKFNLPKKYIVILPFSTDKRMHGRDFDEQDWINTFNFLREKNIKGVVINSGSDIVPESSLLINLTNLTKIEEAVEILKAAEGFIGIDSWLSILAAKIFNEPFLHIKSINPHLLDHAFFYYSPKEQYTFLKPNIKTNK